LNRHEARDRDRREEIARNIDQRRDYPAFRVTNAADIVPWVPWLLGAYRHCGKEIFMPESEFGFMEEFDTDPSVFLKLLRNGPELYREWRRGKLALLDDHEINSYIRRLGTA